MSDDPELDDAIRAAEVTVETLTFDQLWELRHNTGWLGRAAEDQAMIGRALRGDVEAAQLCVDAINARLRRSTP